MDPNTNLAEMLRIANRMLTDQLDSQRAQRLAELVESMNNWITNGGFLPDSWKPDHTALIDMVENNETVCVCLGQGIHVIGSEGCVVFTKPHKR